MGWEWVKRTAALAINVQGLQNLPGSWPLQVRREIKPMNALLLGVESSAPLKRDLFGTAHNPDGKSKDTSAFGKRKWRDFRRGGQGVPADVGGIHLNVSKQQFELLQEICSRLRLCAPSDIVGGERMEDE